MATKEKTVDQLRDAAIRVGCRVIYRRKRFIAHFERVNYYFQVPLTKWIDERTALQLTIAMNRVFKKEGM